jgi:hypothetical protein
MLQEEQEEECAGALDSEHVLQKTPSRLKFRSANDSNMVSKSSRRLEWHLDRFANSSLAKLDHMGIHALPSSVPSATKSIPFSLQL